MYLLAPFRPKSPEYEFPVGIPFRNHEKESGKNDKIDKIEKNVKEGKENQRRSAWSEISSVESVNIPKECSSPYRLEDSQKVPRRIFHHPEFEFAVESIVHSPYLISPACSYPGNVRT